MDEHDLTPPQRREFLEILRDAEAAGVSLSFDETDAIQGFLAGAEGRGVSASLAARFYRLNREIDTEETRAIVYAARTQLHDEASAGNEYAQAILDLLVDDPWWSAN